MTRRTFFTALAGLAGLSQARAAAVPQLVMQAAPDLPKGRVWVWDPHGYGSRHYLIDTSRFELVHYD